MKRTISVTVRHPNVRPKYRHTMTVLGCTVKISKNSSTITGDSVTANELAHQLPIWLKDGMLEGSVIKTTKKGPAYQ